MIGSTHGYGIDLVAYLFEHATVVVVFLRVGILFSHLLERIVVDVAEGDDLAVRASVVGVVRTLATNTNARETDFLIRRSAEARWRRMCATPRASGQARQAGPA